MSKDTARYLPIEEARDAEHPAREPPKAVSLSVFSLWVTGVNAFAVLSVNGLFALLSVNAVCAVLSCNSAFSVLSLNSVFSGAVCGGSDLRAGHSTTGRTGTAPSHHPPRHTTRTRPAACSVNSAFAIGCSGKTFAVCL